MTEASKNRLWHLLSMFIGLGDSSYDSDCMTMSHEHWTPDGGWSQGLLQRTGAPKCSSKCQIVRSVCWYWTRVPADQALDISRIRMRPSLMSHQSVAKVSARFSTLRTDHTLCTNKISPLAHSQWKCEPSLFLPLAMEWWSSESIQDENRHHKGHRYNHQKRGIRSCQCTNNRVEHLLQ